MAVAFVGCASSTNAAAPSWRQPFSPLAFWNLVPVRDVQGVLRRAFRRWGRPLRFRVDNGTPWGSSSDLPTDLTLWLSGLAITTLSNPPRRPQDNGVVERSQGTSKRWVEPGTCVDADELQRRLRQMDQIQREEYPSMRGRSRLEAYPELPHSGRAYSRHWERQHWDLDLALALLAASVMRRKVDPCGSVSLYNRNYYVGKPHARRQIYVLFDPHRREWVFSDERGCQLRSHPAEEICRERIEALTVTNRRHGSEPAQHRQG
jgi:hypothetical protein